MRTDEDLRRHAEAAEKAAREAGTPAEREAFEHVAKGWRDLLAERDRRHRRGF